MISACRCIMEKTYECPNCGKRRNAEEAPECCGKTMKPLPLEACASAFSAENSRPMQDEEPCDDSRG